jgi:periplasmic protein TonB
VSRLCRIWQTWPITLRWALGISVGIHLVVILPLSLWLYATPIAMPQAPLSAVLRGPGEVVHQASQSAQRMQPLSAGDRATPVPKNLLKPQPKQKTAETAAPKTVSEVSAVAGVAQGDPAVAPNAASRPGVQGGAPDTARGGVDADALQRYRLALGVEARKVRRYPEVSRARGQEGVCEVMVVLSRTGGEPVVIAGRSSGSQTLDEAALTMTRVAVERTPVPSELQGRNLKIPLRIRFSLDDL